MIKVIKHGQTKFEHTCSRCGCEFTYEHEDIQSEAIRGLTNYSSTRYVICPDCGNKCYINAGNIGWPWPNIGEPIPCNTPSDTALNPCSTCDWWKKMQQPGFTYVGDTPCTWCNKGPSRVTCGATTATTAISINDNSSTAGTLQLNPEDLKKYNLNIYGYQPTSGSTCPPSSPKSGSNVVKGYN